MSLYPMKLDGVRQKVFLDRYSLKDKDGAPLEKTPDEMWRRVARGIAKQEKKPLQKIWEKKFYGVMTDFKFVPGGRILSGAGTDFQVTYFNCFVIPSPKDSREGILESLKQLVEIQSRSGGVGLNLSSLRPRGARVKKVNGFSSGPVTWAGLFSYATHDVVQQGGSRRGATMLMLHDWHPDVEEFITVKQDLSQINGANLSICVSDEFMKAVKTDAGWKLEFPDLDDPHYDKEWDGDLSLWKERKRKVKVYKTIKARALWDLICTAAWRSAEPGLHFLERSNKRSNTWYFEKLIATNPSLRAGTRVLTKAGIFPIETLEGKKFLVKNIDGKWSEAECFLSGKNKELWKITLNNGREIYATAEHKWPVLAVGGGFGKVTTDKLRPGNILPFPKAEDIDFESHKKLSREEGFMLGWLYGDGWISDRSENKIMSEVLANASPFFGGSRVANYIAPALTNTESSQLLPRTIHPVAYKNNSKQSRDATLPRRVFGFLFSKEDKILADGILTEVNKLKKEKSSLKKARDNTYTIQSTAKEFAENLATSFGVDKKEKGFPVTVWHSGGGFIKGFVDGLISSDGFIAKNADRIVFTTKHKKLADDFSALLSFYGIKSNIRKSEATLVKFPNQKVYSKIYERYDVSIEGHNAVGFGKIFTLSHPRKQALLERIMRKHTSSRALPDVELVRIKAVEKTDIKEDVWDISVYDETHTFYINHCVTGNCGEQPLGEWAVCNLGAMNLSAYVTPNGEFDYKNFEKDVRVAMRFLDNVIDDTYYFFKENEKAAKDIRRTGLGILGLADALIKMKLRYGSPESEETLKKIFETLRNSAYGASADIAKEKSPFPKFKAKKYLKGWHIERLPQEIRQKIAKNGIRNAVLLTIAPTGTTSLISGVSSGVEPVYEFEFIRRDRLGEHKMYHPLFDEWKKDHPSSEKPSYFVSANDLTPEEHVMVQAIAQEYIDSSISKTVNAPNTHSVEDVKNLYMMAYDKGLKGVTYMREGSRAGVLSRIDEKKDQVLPQEIPATLPKEYVRAPRPMMVEGVTYKTQTPVGDTFITLNHDQSGEPFEVFITIGKTGSDLAAMADALGRMISLNLRLAGNLPPRERIRQVISQLSGIGGARSVGFGENRVRSLPDAIAKVLAKQYAFRVNGVVEDKLAPGVSSPVATPPADIIGTGEKEEITVLQQLPLAEGITVDTKPKTHSYDICPECGVSSFVYEEGCGKCYSCGHSEC